MIVTNQGCYYLAESTKLDAKLKVWAVLCSLSNTFLWLLKLEKNEIKFDLFCYRYRLNS